MRKYLTFDLSGRTVVVTGASSGIGRAVTEAFAEAGANLVIVGRNEQRLAATLAAVTSNRGAAISVNVDLTNEAAPATIVNAAIERFGALNVVVNCAGISQTESFAAQSLATFDRVVAINVRAPFALIQAALPHLAPDGAVVNVSSVGGHAGLPQSVAYCASKGALEMMTRALAVELGPQGVRVNCVAPGTILTPMNAGQFASAPKTRSQLEAEIPLGRIGEVDDIASAVVYLASPRAKFVTGASWLIDGGWTAQ